MSSAILDLSPIESWQVDATVKGFPGTHAPTALSEIGGKGWNILGGDVPLPVAVLKRSALDHNRRWMQQFLRESGVALAPHGKTTMSPQLFELQLQDGAWGITCASVEHLQVYRAFAVKRVLMANQLVGRASIEYVVRELSDHDDFEFYCLVDSVDGVRHIVAEARHLQPHRAISLLIELGAPSGRTGARTANDAVAVAREIASHPGIVELRGVETYERAVPEGSVDEREARVRALLQELTQAAQLIDDEGLFASAGEIIVSAGGSDYFDLAAATLSGVRLSRPTLPLLRSGCYLTLDHLAFSRAFERIRARGLPQPLRDAVLMPALEVWGHVQSRVEPTRGYLTIGKRDVSYDLEMPKPLIWTRPGAPGVRALDDRTRITGLHDQHAFVELPADSPLRVGDLVGVGISHPCTTFDKWRLIYVVDDDYRIVGAVRTHF